MAILDTHLRVQHPCPYCDLSVAHPETEIALWCGTWDDAFRVTARNPGELRSVLRGGQDIPPPARGLTKG